MEKKRNYETTKRNNQKLPPAGFKQQLICTYKTACSDSFAKPASLKRASLVFPPNAGWLVVVLCRHWVYGSTVSNPSRLSEPALCVKELVLSTCYQSEKIAFFVVGARCLSADHHLRLTRGPAGESNPTGSLSASPRTTPYQLSRGNTLPRSSCRAFWAKPVLRRFSGPELGRRRKLFCRWLCSCCSKPGAHPLQLEPVVSMLWDCALDYVQVHQSLSFGPSDLYGHA